MDKEWQEIDLRGLTKHITEENVEDLALEIPNRLGPMGRGERLNIAKYCWRSKTVEQYKDALQVLKKWANENNIKILED